MGPHLDFRRANGTSDQGEHYKAFIHRNTLVGGSSWLRFMGAEPYVVEANVIKGDSLTRWDLAFQAGEVSSAVEPRDAGVTDDAGNLAGTYRDQSRGTHGHEAFPVETSCYLVPQPDWLRSSSTDLAGAVSVLDFVSVFQGHCSC
ncbi:hypothetical protein SCOR_32390 [Sulfidibacter corallicola]|uniref:Uncharacterized protein n=1 Tax=Sulfidibacter corallicola TaxID=2818388 RepID=A0A8A4TI84_SULCO|nr:hypothetical protein [Sulfidibacter corallicola]QTD49759.1 hypothetical protein J3U87_29600 [Sulfidibacter corallicola]